MRQKTPGPVRDRSSEAGGCYGCVIPCGVLSLMLIAAAVSTTIFAAHALWH